METSGRGDSIDVSYDANETDWHPFKMMTLLEGNNNSQNYYDLMLRVILFNGDDLDGYDEPIRVGGDDADAGKWRNAMLARRERSTRRSSLSAC